MVTTTRRTWPADALSEAIATDLVRTLAAAYMEGEGDTVELIVGAF